MERFSERENVLWGYTHQRSFENPSSSSETMLRNSDVDFHDVFGGPPRRSSVHEIRHSFIGAVGSEDAVPSRGSWSGMSEKPVFGEENSNRRPYQSGDFFDDIFRGDESYSSPRRADRDPSCSTPGSRVLSPARPLPPRTDPFGTSLPAQFSLPAKLTKSMDLPAFASSNRSPYKYKDGASNRIIYPYTPNASLSVFSSQAVDGQDELINDVRSSYRQSPLSNEFSLKNEKPSYMTKSNETDTGGYLKEDSKSPLSNEFSLKNEEPSYMTKSNETDMGGILKEDSRSVEAPGNNSQFHFSIHKWAGRGVPLHVPLRAGLKSKEKVKLERCSSYNGRDENVSRVSKLFTAIEHDADSLFLNDDISASTESKMERENHDKTKTDNRVETSQIVEEAALKKPESKSLDTVQCTVENILGGTILSDNIDGTKSYSIPETGLSEETEKIISMVTEEGRKPELKPLRSLLHDEIEGQGNGEGTKKTEGKENVVKMAKANVSASKNVKNLYGKRTNSNKAVINEASLQGKPINSGDNIKRSGVKGKVREFVKIFNQEASSMPKINVDPRSQSSRWKSTGINGTDYQTSVSTIGMDKKMHLPNVTKTAYASFTVDENVAQSKKQYSHVKTTMLESSDDASSFSESHPYGSKVTLGYLDDLLQEDFLVKELPHDHDKQPQNGEDYEAIQVLDAKIRQWSNGKQGNIRSLLSTLQYVLWPGSGWKPVPLVDIIEGSAVKRAYQKALLCLHPDKLQQKGAASHQKYIAEKVFGILQEAWDNFNSL